jgi:hypothetical protein
MDVLPPEPGRFNPRIPSLMFNSGGGKGEKEAQKENSFEGYRESTLWQWRLRS